jgi:hypothetical protein
MDRKEALSTQQLALSQNQHQRPFTTEDAEDTGKGKSTTQQRAEALVSEDRRGVRRVREAGRPDHWRCT